MQLQTVLRIVLPVAVIYANNLKQKLGGPSPAVGYVGEYTPVSTRAMYSIAKATFFHTLENHNIWSTDATDEETY